MTYHNPEKQIPIMVDSNSEMYNAMQSDKIKIDDLEKVWLKMFQQTETYNANHIVQCQRMLFESAMSAFQEFSRKDFVERQKAKEADRELSYDEASAYLNCSVVTIKRLVGQGKLNTRKYNNKVVKLTVGELERFRATSRSMANATPDTRNQFEDLKL